MRRGELLKCKGEIMKEEKTLEKLRRRCKLMYVPISMLENIFNKYNGSKFIEIPIFDGLPDGYEVWGINISYERDSFILKIFHPSFEEIQPHTLFPEIESKNILLRKIKVEDPESGDWRKTGSSP